MESEMAFVDAVEALERLAADGDHAQELSDFEKGRQILKAWSSVTRSCVELAGVLRANGFKDFGPFLADHRRMKARAVMCGMWYKASEKKPPANEEVLVCVSGKFGSIEFRDAYELAEYAEGEGWILEGWPQFQGASVSWWMSIPGDTIGLPPHELPVFTAVDMVQGIRSALEVGTTPFDDAFCDACEKRVDGVCPLPDEHTCPYTDEEVMLWYWKREAERIIRAQEAPSPAPPDVLPNGGV